VVVHQDQLVSVALEFLVQQGPQAAPEVLAVVVVRDDDRNLG
jgi:hypothetical protein